MFFTNLSFSNYFFKIQLDGGMDMGGMDMGGMGGMPGGETTNKQVQRVLLVYQGYPFF